MHRENNVGGMQMGAEILDLANASTEKLLASVSRHQLELPSPCASWRVSDVINHIVGNNFWFEAIARDGVAPDRPNNASPDEADGDYVARFREGSSRASAAFGSAMEKTLSLPFAQMPGSVFVVLASADQFVHGWDLVRATGQAADLDPDLASQFLVYYRQSIADEFRGPDPAAPFGPLVATVSDNPVDQLVAITGRRP